MEVNSTEYWELRHARDDWPRWSSWAMEIAMKNIPTNARVMIVGCGQGMEAIKLLNHRPDIKSVYAFDIAKSAIRKAHKNCTQLTDIKDKDKLWLCVNDLFTLNTENYSRPFDYCISIQNLEHWKPETHIEALRRMLRPLKEGGKLFITGVGKSWDLDENNFGPLVCDGEEKQYSNDLHYNNWSEQELYDLLVRLDVECVTFYRKRGSDRVIAEATK